MKAKILVVAIALVTVGMVSVQAQQKQRLKDGTGPAHFEQTKEKPAEPIFTEEQKEDMKAIRLEAAKQMKPFKDQLRELEAHHITLTTADKPDMKAIEASIDEMGSVKTEMAKIQARSHQKVRALLTDEQKLVMDSRKGKMGEKGKHGEFNRGPGQGICRK